MIGSIFFQLDLRNMKLMELHVQFYLLKCVTIHHLCQKERYHKPILLVFGHQNVLTNLEMTTTALILKRIVLIDQTIPIICPFATTGIKVPA